MVDTWGFFSFPAQSGAARPEDVPQSEFRALYARNLELWQKCEEWGLDGICFAEHHFHLLGLAPSPHLIIAALAARTKRLKFTVAGSVLSMHHGWRHAEECGMLDCITGGRFEPGLAPGAGPTESVIAGIPADQIRPRYYSAAEVLGQALKGRVTLQDGFTNLKDVAIVPRPHLDPGQSVWVTVMSPDSAGWTAKRGYKMVTGWMPTSAAAALAGKYYEAADAAKLRATPSMLGLRRRVFVADSDSEAVERYEQSRNLLFQYGGKFASDANPAFEMADPKVAKLVSEPDDFAIGSPETVAERLIEQCRSGGYGVLFAFTDWALYDDFAVLENSHKLLGTRVAAILRKANVERPSSFGGGAALGEVEAIRSARHASLEEATSQE